MLRFGIGRAEGGVERLGLALFHQALAVGRVRDDDAALGRAVKFPRVGDGERDAVVHTGAAGIVARHGDGAGVDVGGEEVIVAGIFAAAGKIPLRLPYAARQAALNLLERALYNDYMALDMASLTGGSLTNVAIRAAMANLNLKADRYEWQVRHFMQELLTLLHLETEEIHFKRQAIANESELVADIQNMRQDIDQRTALRLNPYIADEEIGGLVKGAENPV